MNYTLDVTNLRLKDSEHEMIETRLGLSLSRFASLIAQSNIAFSAGSADMKQSAIHCEITLKLQSGYKIDIRDDAKSVELAFTQALQRSKRSIERHLRHHRGPRLGSSMTTRT
jgi:ribosome-associated translation inhibitor RaiA